MVRHVELAWLQLMIRVVDCLFVSHFLLPTNISMYLLYVCKITEIIVSCWLLDYWADLFYPARGTIRRVARVRGGLFPPLVSPLLFVLVVLLRIRCYMSVTVRFVISFSPGSKLFVIVTFVAWVSWHIYLSHWSFVSVWCYLCCIICVCPTRQRNPTPYWSPLFTAFKKREFGGKSPSEEKTLPHRSTGL